jgi:hypothetical protein
MIADMQAPCPMCRERKLHLMPSGLVRCLGQACPRPTAAQEILDGDVGADIVQIDGDGFSILHPLRERLQGGLFDCPVNRALLAMSEPPVLPGRYRVTFGEDGNLDFGALPSRTEKSASYPLATRTRPARQ